MNVEAAETLALSALTHIVADEKLRDRFMALSGMDPSTLMASANEPGFLAGVLDFLMTDEAALIEFCARADIAPETPGRARAHLPGAAPDW